ncbi:MAG TPA: DUF4390 domain-containing protein [Ottowia sp.]|uniref:DUF4390 domain-containing protein n=1 Tax=Ottowia sp. TaxID=1898956 RepID=UPI002D1D6140|nr:DUF4390 domain-containing protein [Ottowia sp.]HMN22636.1 DUF4390 domain-containing protein [Ottowia sp.]
MPCWKSARLEARLLRVLLVLALVAGPMLGRSEPAQLEELRVERVDGELFLFAQMRFGLAPSVEDALRKGIAVHFVAEARITRERWYWTDERLAQALRYTRVAYQPLTRRWRVNVSSTPITGAALGLGLTQFYDSLEEALGAVQRIAGWRIASAEQLASEGRQTLQFRFRLDSSQLPRTFQLGNVGQADWHLAIERRIDLSVEPGQ